MGTLNYTTKIPVTKTVGEVQTMLGEHGASAVAMRYSDKLPVGVSFQLDTAHGPRSFTLPVDVDAMQRLLGSQKSTGMARATFHSRDHAARVAWRVVKDWIAAQLAIIDAEMATLDQVMLPYLHVDGETTLYQAYRERELRALEPGTAGG